MTLPTLIGFIGVALMMIAYIGLTMGRLSAERPALHWLNLFGALGVIYSLLFEWNLPAFAIECAWAAISLWGLWKTKSVNRE